MNYDFKTNWKDKIKPILKTSHLQKALKQSINNYLKNVDNIDKYDKNKLPFEYSTGDYNVLYYDEIKDNVIEDLLKWGIIKKDPNYPNKEDNEDEYDDDLNEYFDSGKGFEWENSIEHITEPYIRDRMEMNYKAYCLYGACFWYNTNFGLKLAQMVMPSVKWIIKKSNIHATIISTDEKLLFDILYYTEDEDDFGGRKAINDTNNKINWKEYDKIQYELLNNKMSETENVELQYIKERKYNEEYIEKVYLNH